MPRRLLRWAGVVCAAILLGGAASGVFAISSLTRPQPGPPGEALPRYRARMATAGGTRVEDVSLIAADGAKLVGTIARPAQGARNEAVLLAHGLGADRMDLIEVAALLVHAGYTVLAIDERAHGESGGAHVTFGVREKDDLAAWIDWLRRGEAAACVHGYGLSMGASSLLLAAADGAPLCSVWSDSAYASFAALAQSQSAVALGFGPWFARSLGRISVACGFVYARLVLGVELDEAAPLRKLARARVPIMLVHGEADALVPIAQLDQLIAAAPRASSWRVHGAGHVQSRDVAGAEYDRRLLAWLAEHAAAVR